MPTLRQARERADECKKVSLAMAGGDDRAGASALPLLLVTATALGGVAVGCLLMGHRDASTSSVAQGNVLPPVEVTDSDATRVPLQSQGPPREAVVSLEDDGDQSVLSSAETKTRTSLPRVRSEWIRRLPSAQELMQDDLFNPEGIQLTVDAMERLAEQVSDYNVRISDILARRETVITDWAELRLESRMYQQLTSGEVSPPRVPGAVMFGRSDSVGVKLVVIEPGECAALDILSQEQAALLTEFLEKSKSLFIGN